MVVLFKEIKPSRLREDAMRLELLNAMRGVGRQVKKLYEGTTKTWKHKPKFESIVSLVGGPTLVVDTSTESDIYKFVDLGTKPHLIFAGIYTGKSKKKSLFFSSKFKAKTTPGSLKSGAGFRGKRDTNAAYVEHPGTKPRGFTKMIEKKMEKPYKRAMEQAMVKARKVSGHAI